METLAAATKFGSKPAIVERLRSFGFSQLLVEAERLSRALHTGSTTSTSGENQRGKASDGKTKVAILTSSCVDYVASLWATWLNSEVAVPLAPSHPEEELLHVLHDSCASTVCGCVHVRLITRCWQLSCERVLACRQVVASDEKRELALSLCESSGARTVLSSASGFAARTESSYGDAVTIARCYLTGQESGYNGGFTGKKGRRQLH